jgi:hypothetical protein
MKLVRPDQLMISSLLADSEDWMLERLFLYASRQSYTKYSSTLKEAWRLSIMGLNRAITSAAETEADWELTPDADYQRDPACAFGILEAQKHRARGVNLAMFLGLFKYYRQTYQDLLREKGEFEAPRAAAWSTASSTASRSPSAPSGPAPTGRPRSSTWPTPTEIWPIRRTCS